ncbi:alpha/beta hydrolase [Lysinibacillus sp. BW-2-10]|uniref:alpha/beta hydrolase n=1 Tax=Lysinibacillus sp. BW-2-10 TaxID=2590030 RepID=UPI00117CAB21|nr:alpha/beta hydrolase [Lysinibacillus sp. BW-2-10]TSI05129.1 alpha/beta hydrolase [Lysinibacillus sp. BW-2-10]
MKNRERVNPEFLTTLDNFPGLSLNTDALDQIREGLKTLNPPVVQTEVIIEDVTIKGPDQNDLRLRVYKPQDVKGTLPGLLWIHGGGYVLGTVEQDDALCGKYVNEANCIVVAVDYRLAPEHPYPAPIEDCYAAVCWMVNEAAQLAIDVNKIGVAGSSAGGGLTAALTLLARDRQFPKIHLQLPLYPMIDDRNNTPSANEITEGMIWNQQLNEEGWKMYLGDLYGTDHIPSYAAPARATDYSNLPTTYTFIGQLDPFRDETISYVSNLVQAGVDVEFHLYPGAYHAFEGLNPDSPIAQYATNEYINAIKRGFERITQKSQTSEQKSKS